MKALYEEGFPVPVPIAQSRHTIVMTLIDAFPLRQIATVPDPASLYADLIALILRLASHGLIHGDFNEFNILIKETKTMSEDGQESISLEPVVIDFPQMVSMEHQNAEMYFDRDVNCIKRFFDRRFHFTSTQPGPFFKDAKKTVGKGGLKRLDATVEASGFTKKMLKDLEAAIKEKAAKVETGVDSEDEIDSEEDDEDDEEQSDDGDEGPVVIGSATAEEEGIADDGSDPTAQGSDPAATGSVQEGMSKLAV